MIWTHEAEENWRRRRQSANSAIFGVRLDGCYAKQHTTIFVDLLSKRNPSLRHVEKGDLSTGQPIFVSDFHAKGGVKSIGRNKFDRRHSPPHTLAIRKNHNEANCSRNAAQST